MRKTHRFLVLALSFLLFVVAARAQSSQIETIKSSSDQEKSWNLHHQFLQQALKSPSSPLESGNLFKQQGLSPVPGYLPKVLKYQGPEKIQCPEGQKQLCGPGGSSGGAFLSLERAQSVLKFIKEFIFKSKLPGDWATFLEIQVVPQEEGQVLQPIPSGPLKGQLKLSLSSELQKSWTLYDWLIFLLSNSIRQKYISFEQGLDILTGLSQENSWFEFSIFDDSALVRSDNQNIPGCYDRAKIRTNYKTGKIYVELSSTGQCWPSDMRVKSNIPQAAFMNRPLQIQCESFNTCRLLMNSYDEQLAFCFDTKKELKEKSIHSILWMAPDLTQVSLKIPLCLPTPVVRDQQSWDTQQLFLEFKYQFTDGSSP